MNAYFVPQDKIIAANYDINFKNPNIVEEKVDYTLQELMTQMKEASDDIANSVSALMDLIKDIEE